MQRSIGEIYEAIHAIPARTSREKGVICYADELLKAYLDSRGLSLEDIHVRIGKITEVDLLRGAPSWERYSRGGMALVSNEDICLRLGTRYQIQKTERGQKQPTRGGTWAELQAKALGEAAQIVITAVNWRADE